MEILWRYYGDIMEILWRYYGNIMEILWKYMEIYGKKEQNVEKKIPDIPGLSRLYEP